MRANFCALLCIVAAAFAGSACQDLGTLPAEPAAMPITESRNALNTGRSEGDEYVCYTSVATSTGPHAYRYQRVPLRFPRQAVHPGNATHRYRYRVLDARGTPLRVANCVIPRSDQAVKMMNRVFRVSGSGGSIQIQGCVTGGVCTLDPIIVIGDGGGGGGGGAGGGGGGDDGGGSPGPGDRQCMASVDDFVVVQGCLPGGGGDSPDPEEPDSWDDGTGRPKCERDAAGFCITRVVNEGEWEELVRRVELIREDSEACAGAKNALRSLIAQGRESQRIRFWDGFDKRSPDEQRFGENREDLQGRFIEYDSYWVWNDRYLIVHEGLHLYRSLYPDNTGLVGESNEAWVRSVQGTCV